jgi:DNA-binding MarR family transcriptional regulator
MSAGVRPRPAVEEETGPRLIYAIGRFDTVLRKELGRRLKPLHLTIPEFTTLSVLSVRSGLSNAQLARRALVTPQAMNQVLASLEEKGLVRRAASAGGGPARHHRARGAKLTARGERQVRRCQQIVDAVEDASFEALDHRQRVALAAVLRQATERLRTNGDYSAAEYQED